MVFILGQVKDLAEKLESWDHNIGARGGGYIVDHRDSGDKKAEDKLSKATKDSEKITNEVLHGMMTQVIKNKLFNAIQID